MFSVAKNITWVKLYCNFYLINRNMAEKWAVADQQISLDLGIERAVTQGNILAKKWSKALASFLLHFPPALLVIKKDTI